METSGALLFSAEFTAVNFSYCTPKVHSCELHAAFAFINACNIGWGEKAPLRARVNRL